MTRKGTLLVTGAAGFIGSAFAELAVREGHAVVALDALTYAGHRENLAPLESSGAFELVVGTICDGPLVARLLSGRKPRAIVHFAAESHVDRSIDAPAAFIETNIRGTFTLLEAALGYFRDEPRFRFLQVSTDEVYGSLGPAGKFSERSPIAPNSPYSASKASADLLVRAWHHTYGLPTITTDGSNTYGPRQFPEKLIPHLIFRALEGKPLPIYGDGSHVRDWIHVEDHARAILLALERGKPGATYCLGGGAERTNLELARAVCRELDGLRPRKDGKPHASAIELVADRPGHDRRYALDTGVARRELGFRPTVDFGTGLADTVRWYLENDAWRAAVQRSCDLSRRGLPR